MSDQELVAVIEAIEERMSAVKDRVILADRNSHKVNSAYHGGEVAGLNFALALLRPVE